MKAEQMTFAMNISYQVLSAAQVPLLKELLEVFGEAFDCTKLLAPGKTFISLIFPYEE